MIFRIFLGLESRISVAGKAFRRKAIISDFAGETVFPSKSLLFSACESIQSRQ